VTFLFIKSLVPMTFPSPCFPQIRNVGTRRVCAYGAFHFGSTSPRLPPFRTPAARTSPRGGTPPNLLFFPSFPKAFCFASLPPCKIHGLGHGSGVWRVIPSHLPGPEFAQVLRKGPRKTETSQTPLLPIRFFCKYLWSPFFFPIVFFFCFILHPFG